MITLLICIIAFLKNDNRDMKVTLKLIEVARKLISADYREF